LESRIRVRPHLDISFDTFKDKESGEDEAGWSLENRGLGPAFIQWLDVRVDGQQQPNWSAARTAIGLAEPQIREAAFSRNSVLAPDALRILFMVKGSDAKVLEKKKDRVFLGVCYCSFHGDCWFNSYRSGGPSPSSCDDPVTGSAPVQ
jgi:hypothetical protein